MAKIKEEENLKAKILEDQKDYDEYISLESYWKGKKDPKNVMPTKKDLNDIEKFLKGLQKDKSDYSRYKRLRLTYSYG